MPQYPLVSMVRVNQARDRFFNQGELPSGLVPEALVHSWRRSQAWGLSAEHGPSDPPVLSAVELNAAQQASGELIHYSRPVMENLYGQIRHSSSMVMLTDATGTVLHSLGDPGFVGKAGKVSLQPGGIWSEPARGTNAIGTCLVAQTPVAVHRSEHFAAAYHFLTCSASPICDPFGRIQGVLDLSSDSRAFQQHTMALVRISTQQIENMLFSRGFEDQLVLHFHLHPQFIGTFYEGIIVFSAKGALVAANRSALLQLGIDRYQFDGVGFDQLFDIPLGQLVDRGAGQLQPVLELRGPRGKTYFVRFKNSPRPPSRGTRVIGTEADSGVSGRQEAGRQLPPARRQLEDLTLGDAAMQRAIERARKVLKHNIPILIEGESGTGKELFAQALHRSGPRRQGPFVALNCAAIPANLIESELFGYQEGAFTGARRKGYSGKIRQADGGTLFLDEIGDMPMELQARLLRVLQERSVAPLGEAVEQPVDIAVVCATNRKIRTEVECGRFREDLYYRLNGLLLTLPPLRARSDLLPLAEGLLADFAPTSRCLRLSRVVAELFARHPWPGNIRQLHNLLRTAVALLDEHTDELGVEHLPEDFLEQLPLTAGQGLPVAEDSLRGLLDQAVGLEGLEQAVIEQTVRECHSNLSAAARRLGISRATLYRKLGKAR